MEILLIGEHILTKFGGTSTVIYHTLIGFTKIQKTLEQKGINITVMSLGDTGSLELSPNIRIVSYPRWSLRTITGEIQAILESPIKNFDLIHSHVIYELFPWIIKGKPTILTIHGVPWDEKKYRNVLYYPNYELLIRRLKVYYQRLKRFVAISEYVAQEMILHNFDPTKIRIIENPVSDMFFNITKMDDDIILYPARVIPIKNQLGFLRAVELIKHELSDFKIVFTGSGTPKYQNLLKREIEKYNLKNVILLGKIPYEKLLDLYSRAAVVVLTSLHDTAPMVIEESMAAGVPCLASNVGGIPFMIQEYKTGLLTNPNDPIDIAKKLSILVDDKSLRQKIGKNAKKEAERRWSAPIIAKKLLEIYLE